MGLPPCCTMALRPGGLMIVNELNVDTKNNCVILIVSC